MSLHRKHLTHEILKLQSNVRRKYKAFKNMSSRLQLALETQYKPLVQELAKTRHVQLSSPIIKAEYLVKKKNDDDDDDDETQHEDGETEVEDTEDEEAITDDTKLQNRSYGTPVRPQNYVTGNYGSMGRTPTIGRMK